MGLTNSSVGKNAAGEISATKTASERVIAVAGNPNVGKSTLFNALTGMNQHTGNWPGKTVTNAVGHFKSDKADYLLVDIPGTYSLMAHSAEEEVARNFICFSKPDATVVVCDATCLERNLNLVLQVLEISGNVIVCVNLLDEAKRKGIEVNLSRLSELLGVRVIGTVARKKKTLQTLVNALDEVSANPLLPTPLVTYTEPVEKAVLYLEPLLFRVVGNTLPLRWLALRLLDADLTLFSELSSYLGFDILKNQEIQNAVAFVKHEYLDGVDITDSIVSALVKKAESIASKTVTQKGNYNSLDLKIDKVLTSKTLGYPVMILLLMFVFWLTVTGANYPSSLLTELSYSLERFLLRALDFVNCPAVITDLLVNGVYRVLAWVVSVMLPPMAIFFPLFTLLEDLGYLPRVAYNLDKPFKCCNACGKQALTMCMGFGCNAAGVVGCRIIDSPRERLIAILTNSLVPCNGRFPTLISIITMFFVLSQGFLGGLTSALLLTFVISLGIIMTFAISKLLSRTFLKGEPSSFALELPPYRKPQLFRVLVRSVFDRTLFVLARAVAVAAPAGLVIWLMANITVGESTLLLTCSEFLDPLGKLLGLDGVILMAFILGFPANEIVIPLMLMAYLSNSSVVRVDDISVIKQVLLDNGWTIKTAICTVIFSMFHWPCSTTVLTIKKETGSLKWTALSILIPTVIGVLLCMLVNIIG